jgi:hypothetical protein
MASIRAGSGMQIAGISNLNSDEIRYFEANSND